MKIFWVLLDVDLKRDKVFVDECGYRRVFVRLGFQPSTGASIRRRREVYEKGPFLFSGEFQCGIGVPDPIDGHVWLPPVVEINS